MKILFLLVFPLMSILKAQETLPYEDYLKTISHDEYWLKCNLVQNRATNVAGKINNMLSMVVSPAIEGKRLVSTYSAYINSNIIVNNFGYSFGIVENLRLDPKKLEIDEMKIGPYFSIISIISKYNSLYETSFKHSSGEIILPGNKQNSKRNTHILNSDSLYSFDCIAQDPASSDIPKLYKSNNQACENMNNADRNCLDYLASKSWKAFTLKMGVATRENESTKIEYVDGKARVYVVKEIL